ncbi:MAG: ubiquitin-like protein Pup [Marmoricola sp.]
MAQEHKQPHRSSGSEAADEVETSATEEDGNLTERKEQLDEDIDAILDEIDEVLESNAEDFVKSFVQKGGQ